MSKADETVETKAPVKKLLKTKPKAKEEVVEQATEAAEVADVKADTTEAQSLVEAKPAVVKETDLIVLAVAEVDKLKEDKAFKLVPELLNSIDHDYFKLGGVLALIQTNGWYLDRGFENFRQYVEADGGMLYRKAMYLISIYNGLSASGVPWDKVKGLGWTMLKELATILTPENVDEWVAAVTGMTVLQAQEYIKVKSAGLSQGDSADEAAKVEVKKTSTMSFKVHEDQKDTIREALDKAKHESGTEYDAVALENICLDFLSGDSKLKKMPTLQELMTGMNVHDVIEVLDKVFPDCNFEIQVPE